MVDLFCGAGGLSEGFRAAGFEVTFALDRDSDSCETYRRNHPATTIENASITDFTPRELAQSKPDVILGGPSCQGFSTHGRRKQWADLRLERNRLWRHMLAVVKAAQPRAFLLENVPGFAYAADTKTRRKKLLGIEERFAELGYTVHREILLAANYGVPQLRRRVFVVGVRTGLSFTFPPPSHMGGWRRDTLELWEKRRTESGLPRHLTSWEALGDLPPLGDGTGHSDCPYPYPAASEYAALMRRGSTRIHDHESAALWPRYAPLVAHVPQGGTWRDIPPHLLPDRYRGMRRTDSTNLLGRLDPARPAYTITTQFNNISAGCFIHPFEDRSLSVREGARLQSFPDRYRFEGSISSRCRQIGNAVPPLLAQHLAAALAATIDPGSKPKRPRTIRPIAETPDALQLPIPVTKRRMQSQLRRDTLPEVGLQNALTRKGLRFHKNVKPLPDLRREVDILFVTTKVAVFVDGCFWHGCPQHTRPTKSNTKWWADKIATNQARDIETTAALKRKGYRVIRVWEHEDPEKAADRVEAAIERRKQQ